MFTAGQFAWCSALTEPHVFRKSLQECGSVDDKSRAFEKCWVQTAINYVICLFLVSLLFSWHAFIGFRPLAQEIVCLTLSKESTFFQCWLYVPTLYHLSRTEIEWDWDQVFCLLLLLLLFFKHISRLVWTLEFWQQNEK